MEYRYKIYKEVYDDMISGKKNIEYRLLNEKSDTIQKGDNIKFILVDNEEKYIITEVLDKIIYENVDELWKDKEVTNNILNLDKEGFINIMTQIFGKETFESSKIVGIKFKLIGYNE